MNKQVLDYFMVPMGLVLMMGYHLWLLYRIKNHPKKTIIGINTINRRVWVEAMMEDPAKTGVLAVQTLRNNIMASTLLASTAIMLSSIIAVLMTSKTKDQEGIMPVYGDTSELGVSIKFVCILLCFLLGFFMNVQSIRYYSHASILINVPLNKISSLTPGYVGKAVNKGSYFWSLGLRAFYFSFPLFLWIFGPIPMFFCCILLVSMLYFLDVAYCDFGETVSADDEADVEQGRSG